MLTRQGDLVGAIKEYHDLAKEFPGQVPQFRPILARLLIEYNQRRPESQRDWNEVKELIDQMDKASPGSAERFILRALLLSAQGDQTAARNKLEEARAVFPRAWTSGSLRQIL